jgi:hypothetical protein
MNQKFDVESPKIKKRTIFSPPPNRKLASQSMNYTKKDDIINAFIPKVKSPMRMPVDKCLDTGPKGGVSIKLPYQSIAQE